MNSEKFSELADYQHENLSYVQAPNPYKHMVKWQFLANLLPFAYITILGFIFGDGLGNVPFSLVMQSLLRALGLVMLPALIIGLILAWYVNKIASPYRTFPLINTASKSFIVLMVLILLSVGIEIIISGTWKLFLSDSVIFNRLRDILYYYLIFLNGIPFLIMALGISRYLVKLQIWQSNNAIVGKPKRKVKNHA